MHYVVNILPQVMVFADMACEATLALLIKSEAFEMADETLVVLVGLHEILLFSQLCECVDDNTEEDVVKDNLN